MFGELSMQYVILDVRCQMSDVRRLEFSVRNIEILAFEIKYILKIMEALKVEPEVYKKIAEIIQSDQSPVGIDAKKTHIIILEKLLQLESRLERIEKKLL